MSKNKMNSILQTVRLIVQIICFILIPGIYINTFAGIKQIYLSIVNQNFSLAGNLLQLIEVIAVIPVTVILGRFFCGWMCAFGTLGDVLYRISSKFFKIKFKVNENLDRVLKYFKFVLLAFLIVVVWTFDSSIFKGANPWDAFGVIATVGKIPDIPFAFAEFTVGTLLLMAIIIASFFVERFFCRYLCPLGAIFSIASRIGIVKISKPSQGCGACKICTSSCAMGIPLYKYDKVKSGECIQCSKCVTACPRNNAVVKTGKEDVRTGVAAALAVTCMTGIYYAGTFASNAAGLASTPTSLEITSREPENKIYADGTYEGSGIGFRGAKTTVSVTVKNDTIKDIKVVSYGDDAPYFNRAYNSVASEILSSQTTEVDAVSGATYSSVGIMDAVADALKKAKLSPETTPSVTQEEAVIETSTPTSTPISAPISTPTSESNVSENKIYVDGTYEGSGIGFRGAKTTVSVTVKNGTIKDIKVVSYGDDAPYFDRAYNSVASEILSSQTTEVDAVSGATYSSVGIMDAVADALKKAMVSPENTPSGTKQGAVKETSTPTIGSNVSKSNKTDAPKKTTGKPTQDVGKNTSKTPTAVSKPTPALTAARSTPVSKTQNTKPEASNTKAPESTPVKSSSATYRDGTYEGSAKGFRNGITKVSVVIKDGKIADVKVISHGDDAPFFDKASTVMNGILETQLTDVDVVSGATYSSKGIINAVEDALLKARIE